MRYAALFTAVGAALPITSRVYAASFSAVSVGVLLPILLRLAFVLSCTLLLGWMLPLYNAVGMDVAFAVILRLW